VVERSPGSQAARHRLGTGLKRLREQANLRLDAAAQELECSIAKISRLENGLGPAKLWDVRILLDLYGVQDAGARQQFEEWARDSKSVGWWEPDADLTSEDLSRYLSNETDAARVRIFCVPWLPSQLQTADYARAQIMALHPDWPAEDVDRFVNLRLARQEALLRADVPPEVEVVVDEAAVRRRVGTRSVHAAALSWLVSTLDDVGRADRHALTFRIVPFSAGPSRALTTFTIFEPRLPDLDSVTAHSEDTFGERWVEDDQLDSLNDIFSEVTGLALDPRSSRMMLEDILGSL
jgi:transcriptional regulator with XRE-family HTH domain